MSKESGPFPVSKEPIQELIPHRGVLQSGSVQPEGIRNATVLHVAARARHGNTELLWSLPGGTPHTFFTVILKQRGNWGLMR